MKISKRTQEMIKNIMCVILIVGIVIGLGALVAKMNEEEYGYDTIHPSFSVGGLTASGKYTETKYSIYTKEGFYCKGLKIELEFDNNISYQVFYYDSNDYYVSKSSVYNSSDIKVSHSVPEKAVTARIVITPEWSDETQQKDKELSFFDIYKYSSQMKIMVYEDQGTVNDTSGNTSSNTGSSGYEGMTNVVTSVTAGTYNNDESKLYPSEGSPWFFTNAIDVSDSRAVIVKVYTSTLTAYVTYGEVTYGAFLTYVDGGYSPLSYDVLSTDGDLSYVQFDVESYDEFILTVDEVSKDIVEVYLVD